MATPEPAAATRIKVRFAAARANPESIKYLGVLSETPFLQDLLAGQLSLEWTNVRVLRDDPAKTLDTSEHAASPFLDQLMQALGHPQTTLDIVSAYFVPGKKGAAVLASLATRGVKVRVLTNSLAATDVAAVHAGYVKHRAQLLRSGVRLFELKRWAAPDHPKRMRTFGGSSASSLHVKTFATDGKRVFVGSFNLDQRSIRLNTELGLLIDSPTLAAWIATQFDTGISKAAYEVRIKTDGGLEWIDRGPTAAGHYDVEPCTGLLTRSWVQFLSLLPIDWLL
jgi:putative cardiolipin synthase